jgi:two-component system, chemotaxis family, sensor kinase Cph1
MQPSAVDLTNCDREPIHIPGAIQSYGVLLVLEEPSLTIIQASANAPSLLSINAGSVVGSSLSALLGEDAVAALQKLILSCTPGQRPHYLSQLRIKTRQELWSAAVHRRDDILLLELQPNAIGAFVSSQMQDAVRKAVMDLDTCESLPSFCQAAAEHFRDLTQFDRVMVYRFLEDGAGVVIAESRVAEVDSYLGLHYPASDIPVQARELYRLNPFRLTADVNAPAVPIVPTLNPKTGKPLDLSLCALRATSPIHLEYLRNMGVAASLSFSILHNEKLWGLVACHHRSPKTLAKEVRIAGEILVHFIGLQVVIKEEAEYKQYAAQLQDLRAQLRTQLSASGDYVTALMNKDSNLLSVIKADGVALCTGSQTVMLGQTPSEEQVQSLRQWVQEQQPWQPFWATHALSLQYPPAQSFLQTASGILVLQVTQGSPEIVIWFRPEVKQTVNWAGNPAKPAEKSSENGHVVLHPRRSFALWQEQVSGQSCPWQSLELEHAQDLREDMSQALLKHRALEVSRLNAELTRSNQELEQFAAMAGHDLQEPLRTITAYTELVFRRNRSKFDPNTTEMIEFIVGATKRMSTLIRSLLDYARSGRQERGTERVAANDALQLALNNLRTPITERNARIDVAELPTVRAHLDQLARVFQNLIANALKYCPLDRVPSLNITAERQGQEWLISLQDNGAGFDPAQKEAVFQSFYRLQRDEATGTGLGLAICRKIIQSFGGRIWAETTPGEGSTFQFTLPAA